MSCSMCDKESVVTCFKCGKPLCDDHLNYFDESGSVVCSACLKKVKRQEKKQKIQNIMKIVVPAIAAVIVLIVVLAFFVF